MTGSPIGFNARVAKIAWTVALVALALYTIYAVRRTLFIFVLAIFFSYMVYPLVRYLDRFTPRRVSHTLSTITVFVAIVLGIAGVGILVGPAIGEQASRLADQLPALIRDPHIAERLPLPHWLVPYRAHILDFARTQFEAGTAYALPMARQVGQGIVSVVSNLIFLLLIPVLAFLFIKDGPTLRDRFVRWLSAGRYAAMWTAIVDDLDLLVGHYIRALLILALATVVVYSLFFSVAGVPYGLLLGSIAGAMEFVPVIGPLAAAVISIAVAALSGYSHLLLLVGFIVLYRLFQDYVLNPYLMSDGVKISPLLVLFGILAGEELGGVVGIFLSVPIMAAAKIVMIRITQASKPEGNQYEQTMPALLSAPTRQGIDPLPPPGDQPDGPSTAHRGSHLSRRRRALRWFWPRSKRANKGRT
jgi:predicted PurR-regulated permease PerM